MVNNLNNLKEADYKKAIEIKPGIFWVGSNIIDDDFQCHPYLLVNGKNSVLFDPGSVLTFLETFSKIESIIPFSHIRYFVCHHQDPDITGALNIIDSFISREDAVILSHWRAIAILKHLGLRIPLQCVEEMGWSLDIGNNMNLKFIFSPYLHFPGAFVTYLESQKALFSSDIFGAISPEFNLIAQDEKCYDGIRLFHEHYMPSHEILLNFLNKLENIELDVILPQHGSIIPRRLIPFIINKLKVLECGVYTLTQTSTELKKLSRLNKLISDITKIIILSSDFKQIINVFLEKADLILNIEDLFFVSQDDDGEIRILGKDNIKTEKNVSYCKACRDLYGKSKKEWLQEHGKLSIEADSIIENETDKSENAKNILLIPLFNFDNDILIGLIYVLFKKEAVIDTEIENTLNLMVPALSAVLEREIIKLRLDKEKNKFYRISIKDSLTGLYTRFYMDEMMRRFCRMQDRDDFISLGVIYFDIDNFKIINDTYGHTAGDMVLKKVAKVLLDETRGDDLQVRLGGEELAVIFLSKDKDEFEVIGNRIREKISELDFPEHQIEKSITVSGGVSIRVKGEPVEKVFNRADQNLYKAKNQGKNKIICDE